MNKNLKIKSFSEFLNNKTFLQDNYNSVVFSAPGKVILQLFCQLKFN